MSGLLMVVLILLPLLGVSLGAFCLAQGHFLRLSTRMKQVLEELGRDLQLEWHIGEGYVQSWLV